MAQVHWLDKAIEKYGNDKNNGKDDASKDPYEWKWGGNGGDSDGDGKIEYDCSHFVNRLLQDRGYTYGYETTTELHNSNNYSEVDKRNLQKGDIVLFNGHVGFFYGYNDKGAMLVYSSSGSNITGVDRGPAITPASWFGKPDQFLRPNAEIGAVGSKGFLGGIIDSIISKIRSIFTSGENTGLQSSPIILDLDKDGVETTALNNGTYFDHDANGFSEQTGWASSDDGLLVLDRDADGLIEDGTELFGNNTLLADGTHASNGFQALAELDTNADGKIDSTDTAYSQLKVWQDIDEDGYTSEGELKTLSELGIQSINTFRFQTISR